MLLYLTLLYSQEILILDNCFKIFYTNFYRFVNAVNLKKCWEKYL